MKRLKNKKQKEILLANGRSKTEEFIYDKTVIVLVAALIIFSMLMAIIGVVIESDRWYYLQTQAKYQSELLKCEHTLSKS